MRALVDAPRIHSFMRELGRAASSPAQVYLTGGASAVLLDWRKSTIDIDVKLVPDSDPLLRAIPALKERLQVNVELASPADFIPVREGWEDRSLFVAQEGPLTFRHFDFEAQALAKVERGHAQDRIDVHEMLRRNLVDADGLRRAFDAIAPQLYRFPAVDPGGFRQALEKLLADAGSG